MKDNTFKKIIDDRVPCYFISPHFDDAILSAGALIEYLSDKTQVAVINVFTKGSDRPYSLSAKVFLRKCGFTDSAKLYEERVKEDAAVFSSLPVTLINFPYVDALWRRKIKMTSLTRFLSRFIAEISYIYPAYYFIAKGRISQRDQELMKEIKSSLEIVPARAMVFCPIALGSHVDHVIVNKVCSEMFANVIYWSDFPYNKKDNSKLQSYHREIFTQGHEKKIKRIQQYHTQYSAMFPNALTAIPDEEYFMSV